jgi:uncharacterized protein
LSKDALAGTVPLRTFGQLKQLWEARVEGPPESGSETPAPYPTVTPEGPAEPRPAAEAAEATTTAPAETAAEDAAKTL